MALLNTAIGPERVQAFPVPLGTVQIAGSATSITAFLISTTQPGAPVNAPLTITDLTSFTNTFGGPDQVLYNGYYAVEGYYNNAGTGATAIIVNVGNGTQQVETITCVADVSGSLNSTYFLMSSANNATNYYVWYNVNGAGVDPHVSNRTGIMVAIPTNASANATAAATATAIQAANHGLDFTTGAASAVVTVTDVLGGLATTPVDGGAPTGFTFALLTPGVAVNANSFIGNASLGSGLRALDAIDALGLVCVPGLPLSLSYLVQPALVDYSLTVRAEFGATLSTTFSLLAVPQEITTSSVDRLLTSTPTFTSVSGSAPWVITFSGSLSVSVIPGTILKNSSGSFLSVITAVSGSTVTVLEDPTGSFTSGDHLFFYMPSAVTYVDDVINTPSIVSGWYYNWVVTTDESPEATPGETTTVDPTGHVAGVIGRIDANTAIGGVSHAPAGIQFAGISGILGLNLAISERVDAGPLRLAFINRITSFPSAGNVIFGAYTNGGNSVAAEEQLIQVMRTLQFIKGSLESGLQGFIWENFSPDTQTDIEKAILSFLRNNSYLFPAGLPEAQQFKVISVTPTQDELNQGLLRVRVQVRPNTAVRFIEIALEFPLPTS